MSFVIDLSFGSARQFFSTLLIELFSDDQQADTDRIFPTLQSLLREAIVQILQIGTVEPTKFQSLRRVREAVMFQQGQGSPPSSTLPESTIQ